MMKFSQVILLSFCIAHGAFSQESVDGLIGKWQFVSKSGGMTGKIIVANPEDQPKIIEFTSDSIFREYKGDSLIFEKHYQVIKSKSIFHSRSQDIIIFDKKSVKQSFSVHGSRLTLKDECYDCFGHIYRRVKPLEKKLLKENNNR